jgi:hypothetical protein
VEHRVELVIDPLRGEKFPISLPLRYRVPPDESRGELGLPDFVDLSDPLVAKVVALAAAAARANPPARFAAFGGVAFRMRCPSSNDRQLGLRHPLHDLDLAVPLKEARAFQRFLASAAAAEGSGLTFFETSGDRIYNSLSGGRRLRWHMVLEQRGSELVLGTLDLIADEFEFCHRLDVRGDLEQPARQGWTLVPTHLLLTKGQFIQRIPLEDSASVPDRVLAPIGKRHVAIGPEAKDVRDILALLHDHPIGEGAGEISLAEIRRRLESDWGFWKTFGLNLSMIERSPILKGLPEPARLRISGRLDAVSRSVAALAPKRRLGFLGGTWWQEVDSTPSVDGAVSID